MFQGPLLFIVDKVGEKILNVEMVVFVCMRARAYGVVWRFD